MFSKRPLKRGDFVCEYAGDLISHDDARLRETEYASNPDIGCYMYYFVHDSKKYWYVFLCIFSSSLYNVAIRGFGFQSQSRGQEMLVARKQEFYGEQI